MAASLRSWLLSVCGLRTQQTSPPVFLTWRRYFRTTPGFGQEEENEVNEADQETAEEKPSKSKRDERPKIDVETSIRYVDSEAFAIGYKGKPVWFYYRRNHKGLVPPKTRKNCIRQGRLHTASPCPVCRDPYLVLDAKNTKLLDHFISPYSGEILGFMKTGLCQHQHRRLTVAVMQAWDEGRLEMKLPFRYYDYKDYTS